MTIALVTLPCSNQALTVSTKDALSPGSCRSGCLIVVLAELLSDRPERMDWVSDAACSSESSVLCGGLKAGDAGCATGAGAGNVAVEGPEPAEGSGGASPILCNSGAAGLGTKMVLRTSRRPRRVDARLGGAACCCIVSSGFPIYQNVHTARKVLTMFAIAASASPSSSWMGAFLISSLNCGVELLSAWALLYVSNSCALFIVVLTSQLPARPQ